MLLSIKIKSNPEKVMYDYYKSINPHTIEDIEMMQRASNNIWMVKNNPEGLKGESKP